jgi:hypothetical protein
MNKHISPVSISLHLAAALAALALAASAASAGPEPYESQNYTLSTFVSGSVALRQQGSTIVGDGPSMTEADCTKVITELKDAGAKPDARLHRTYTADELTMLGDLAKKDDKGVYVLVKDAPRICQQYASLKRALPGAQALLTYARGLDMLEMLPPEHVGDGGAGALATAEQCAPALDEAIKKGAATDAALTISTNLPPMTLEEARTKICGAYVDKAKSFTGAVEASRKAAYEKIAAPYIKLGVKGDRLELFVSYESAPFYDKGCKAEILDIKKLVKAKVLFHWLDASDGTITIRKYTIKGNSYKISEKTYDRQAQAYKGCR